MSTPWRGKLCCEISYPTSLLQLFYILVPLLPNSLLSFAYYSRFGFVLFCCCFNLEMIYTIELRNALNI